MNFLYLAPHYPPHYRMFCYNMNQLGVNVLGLADEPREHLDPLLQSSLVGYYQVANMYDYEELMRACGYFIFRYGKLDRIESQNEYLMETEARLRADFNIFGLQPKEAIAIRRKSEFRARLKRAGVLTPRGRLAHDVDKALRFARQHGFPLVARPDLAVAAAKEIRIDSRAELEHFFAQKLPVDYLLEQEVPGEHFTFDGLVDRDGEPVFYTAHQYGDSRPPRTESGPNEYGDAPLCYFSLRDIPPELESAGRRVLSAFHLRETLFRIEFVCDERTGEWLALDILLDPPGGLTIDMFNYANDIDLYQEWASVVAYNKFNATFDRKYHCAYVGRRGNFSYTYTGQQILDAFPNCIVYHGTISTPLQSQLGDYGYMLRSPWLEETLGIIAYIQKRTA